MSPILHGSSITILNLNNQALPKQPVPDLKQTAERYLRSLKPLLNSTEYKNTEKIVHEFVSDSGVGSQLHTKLLQRYQNTENWMREWWLQITYLRYRGPLIVNSNPGTIGPPIIFKKSDDVYVFVARFIAGVCDYNQAVKSGKMKQEMFRKDPLDMQAYNMLLGTHRQPNKVIDKLLHTDEAKHIIVISNNHCIISADGFVGMEYEHSSGDGIPLAVFYDYVLKYIAARKNDAKTECAKDFPRPELLKFETNDAIEHAIEKATVVVDKLCNDIDMECFTFHKFGADAIKAIKFSPDSFIQIAMQVTFFNLHKKPPAHYETAALRRFINARTECIRSTSIESVEFAEMMLYNSDRRTKAQKKEMMIRAINAHKYYAGQAVIGQGVDRHLLGLKIIAHEEGMELPELYKDVGYTRSTYFTLTSSQVPLKSASFMCYGPVVPDGYGCCYNPRPKDILFACSSFKSCKETNTKDFACVLQQTLCNMRDIGNE